MIDLDAARTFMTTHARVLDRRRFALLFDGEPPDGALGALAGYANADGGYSWGLEPDLRAPASQIGGALHAFEVIGEASPVTTPAAAALADWLESVTCEDGGLPFATAGAQGEGTAPFWAAADPAESSLHMTTAVLSKALVVADSDPVVAAHPWLATATDYAWRSIEALEPGGPALELRYCLEFLDAMAARRPEAAEHIARLMSVIPASGVKLVEGGAADEAMRATDWSPLPGRPTRDHLADGVIDDHLAELATGQRDDGGWDVDFGNFSPAAELEWRGYRTVAVLELLRTNGRALT